MNYDQILTYLLEGGGLALAARGLWFAWMQWNAYRDSQAARTAVSGRREIIEALKELRYNTPANYAHIIRVHNGGGDLKAGLPMYMSCLYEEHDLSLPRLKNQVLGIEIDDHYRTKVERLLKLNDLSEIVSQTDNELMQDIYQVMKAKFYRVVLIRVNRDGIYFLRTTSSTDPLDSPETNIHFRKAVSLLKKHY